MIVRGSVDLVTGTEVCGWAYAPERHGAVSVQVVLDHEILGEAVASGHRPDLAAAGLGDGHCGYAVRLYRKISALYLPFLSVKVEGGDAELPRSGAAGFQEYFSALHRAHPACGRSRSVYGGLWTDRTDAASVLRGKLDTGQVAATAAPALAQLIQGGLAMLDLGHDPATVDQSTPSPEWIGAVLDDSSLLAVLRAAFDDHPLVVRAARLRDDEFGLGQPSAANPAPSPGECLALVVALGEGVVIDMVRDGHLLPEFTSAGASRWTRADSHAGVEIAMAAQGLMDRYLLPEGSVAVIGAGALHRVRCGTGAQAIRLLCLPSRLLPVALATGGAQETICRKGARIWL